MGVASESEPVRKRQRLSLKAGRLKKNKQESQDHIQTQELGPEQNCNNSAKE